MYPVAVRDREEMRIESVYGNILPSAAEAAGFVLGTVAAYNTPSVKALGSRYARMGTSLGGGAIGTVTASKLGGPIFDYLRRKKIQDLRRSKGQPITDERDMSMYLQGKSPLFIGKGDVTRSANTLVENNGKVSAIKEKTLYTAGK